MQKHCCMLQPTVCVFILYTVPYYLRRRAICRFMLNPEACFCVNLCFFKHHDSVCIILLRALSCFNLYVVLCFMLNHAWCYFVCLCFFVLRASLWFMFLLAFWCLMLIHALFYTMLDAASCFMLLHVVLPCAWCCPVLDTAPCFMLLHISCFSLLDASLWFWFSIYADRCFIQIHALSCFVLHAASCFSMLNIALGFVVLYAWCCSKLYAHLYLLLIQALCFSILYAVPYFILLHAWCFMYYADAALCCFMLIILRVVFSTMRNAAPRRMLPRAFCC